MRCAYLPPTKYANYVERVSFAHPPLEQMVDALRLSTPYKIYDLFRAGKPRAPAVGAVGGCAALIHPTKYATCVGRVSLRTRRGSRWWMRYAYLPPTKYAACVGRVSFAHPPR